MSKHKENPELPIGETPRIPKATNEPTEPVYKEVHAQGKVEKVGQVEEEKISDTRDFILAKYIILKDNCLILPSPETGRRIRAFTILESRHDPAKKYYAEGHTSHAILLEAILGNFKPDPKIHSRFELEEEEDEKEFNKNWITRKGFLDPSQNGFQSFPEARSSLINQLKEHHNINGLTEEEVERLTDEHMPNWFLSGDSSSESPKE